MHSVQHISALKGTTQTTVSPIQNAFSEIQYCKTDQEVFSIKNIK